MRHSIKLVQWRKIAAIALRCACGYELYPIASSPIVSSQASLAQVPVLARLKSMNRVPMWPFGSSEGRPQTILTPSVREQSQCAQVKAPETHSPRPQILRQNFHHKRYSQPRTLMSNECATTAHILIVDIFRAGWHCFTRCELKRKTFVYTFCALTTRATTSWFAPTSNN